MLEKFFQNSAAFPVFNPEENTMNMSVSSKHLCPLFMSTAIATWSVCMERPCQASERTRTEPLAKRVKALEAEDFGILPADQAQGFSATIFKQAQTAGLPIMSCSRVQARTNALFSERQQDLTAQGTEQQLLDFLRNIAASNSVLRVTALALHPNPDRTALLISAKLLGSYRLKPGGGPQRQKSLESEYQVLMQRRMLRYAALDCYKLTKDTLPEGWTLEALNFEEGKALSLKGVAPGDQARSVEDLRAKLESAKGSDGRELFIPSGGEAAWHMSDPGMTQFSWSVVLKLRPAESP